MKQARIWISAAALVAVLIAMYAINQAAMAPKPKPDILYEGRLAYLNETNPSPAGAEKPSEPEKPGQEEPASAEEKKPEKAETTVVKLSEEEKALVGKAEGSVVKLETSKGDIVLELYDDKTPIHVGNFLDLVDTGFYNGIKFHRVIANFMIQGGCPKGDGTGGPGYTLPAEFNSRKHEKGTLAMARTMDPDSAGSQFYICLDKIPHLDGQYTVFGRVVKGNDLPEKVKMGDKMKIEIVQGQAQK